MSLHALLEAKADELAPIGDYPDGYDDWRRYAEHDNPAAIDGDRWLEEGSSYIWRVGVLLQGDSNKCDWLHVFLGDEREPGRPRFIGHLHFDDGENDDPGRVLKRAIDLLAGLHPTFDKED